MSLPTDRIDREMGRFIDKGTDANGNYKTGVRSGSHDESTGTTVISDVAPAVFETIEVTLANAITSTATSASVDVSKYKNISVQCKMTTSHTTAIDATVDGTNWVTLTSVTTSTITSYSNVKYKYIRANTTAVSGALTITLIAGN